MKFDNILLASDVDGTFSWNQAYTNPRNYTLIDYFKKNGGKFTFSSGRNSKDIYYMIDNLEGIVNAPCVLCNGSLLFDIHTKKIENPFYLHEQGVLDILKYVRDRYLGVIGWRASFADGFYACEDDTAILSDLNNSGLISITHTYPYEELTGHEYYKCVFRGEEKILDPLFPILMNKYPMFDFTRSVKTLIELSPKGVSKATQLAYLKEKYKKQGKDLTIVCIGDYDNDIDMLKYADISICPENANDNVKSICTKQVCHCKDGALAEAIEYLDKIF